MTSTDAQPDAVTANKQADRDELERRTREDFYTYPAGLLESVVRNTQDQVDQADEKLWYWTMVRDTARDELKRRQEQTDE
jgi:hypothetical protein